MADNVKLQQEALEEINDALSVKQALRAYQDKYGYDALFKQLVSYYAGMRGDIAYSNAKQSLIHDIQSRA